MHNGITQPVLGAVGHHLLNRQVEGNIDEHLRSWNGRDLTRAAEDLDAELHRVRKYERVLLQTRGAVTRAMW